ncbi:anti-anti-sigma factor [Anseongella ginsenosidimutans]|uniref:Anti-sigma factor antagonist n=1 Tax=Anseongella ginsenosidimutans TaxID=496056 RepID=A0A4R3KSN1_9SPHI|nr:STAS domain-containing protein [Anseongella ginsenosidimutans]QEC53335.1 STAS domain-containing protein [Anseongella ginsenosidimutans]TCS88218.1 anti-anti-sigma factor [Anseongella ginsenosidimutans]
MKYSVDKNEKYILLTLEEDRLNSLMSPALKSELVIFNAEGFRNIILDLSHVDHIDSSGLSCLLTANRICQNSGGSFVLTGLKPTVEQLIGITQLDKSLKIVPTKEEAIDFVYMEELEREINKKD